MDLSTLPTTDLVRLCSDAGQTDAWAELIRRFERQVSRAVAARCGGCRLETIEDLVQQTWMRLLHDDCRYLREFQNQGEDSFAAYLRRIASSVTLDYLRKEGAQKRWGDQNQVTHEDDDAGWIPDPGSSVDSHLIWLDIRRCLERLMPKPVTEKDYSIFLFRFWQQYTAREISLIPALKLSAKGVESSILRTTRLLRHCMQASQTPAEPGAATKTSKGNPGSAPFKEVNG